MLLRLLLFFACNVCHGYTYYQSFQPVASPSGKTASIYQLQSVPFIQSCAAALSVGDALFLSKSCWQESPSLPFVWFSFRSVPLKIDIIITQVFLLGKSKILIYEPIGSVFIRFSTNSSKTCCFRQIFHIFFRSLTTRIAMALSLTRSILATSR